MISYIMFIAYSIGLILSTTAAVPTGSPTSAIITRQATSSCPATVSDGDIVPYALVHTTPAEKSKKHGIASNIATKPKDMCSWWAFQVPQEPKSLCSLTLLLPNETQLPRFAKYEFIGGGSFSIQTFFNTAGDENDLSSGMKYDEQPALPANRSEIYNYNFQFKPGNVYSINTGACSPSKSSKSTRRLFVKLCSSDTTLTIPQGLKGGDDTRVCASGLYVLKFPK